MRQYCMQKESHNSYHYANAVFVYPAISYMYIHKLMAASCYVYTTKLPNVIYST